MIRKSQSVKYFYCYNPSLVHIYIWLLFIFLWGLYSCLAHDNCAFTASCKKCDARRKEVALHICLLTFMPISYHHILIFLSLAFLSISLYPFLVLSSLHRGEMTSTDMLLSILPLFFSLFFFLFQNKFYSSIHCCCFTKKLQKGVVKLTFFLSLTHISIPVLIKDW